MYSVKHHTHLNTTEKRFDNSLTQDDDLKQRTFHTKDKKLKCKLCEKKYTQSSHLKSHMFTHTGDKPYTCKLCDKGFTQSGNLKSHMFIHSGVKPYACGVCDERFKQSGTLKRHLLIKPEKSHIHV